MRGLVLLSLLVACASAADRVGADPAQPGEVPPFDRGAVRVRESRDPADAASAAAAKLLTRVAQVEASLVDSTYQARTQVDERRGVYRWDCSGMTTWLLKRSAPRALASLASSRPVARDYYRAIARAPLGRPRRGWQRLAHVKDARPGDLFAFLRSPISTSKITGHVGVIVGWPTEIPDWPGAWAVRIADSTRGGHGDDPRAADLDGGFGVGTMLFVTDAAGVVTHYGWIGLASPWLMPTTVLFGRVAG
ncbi:MAG: hypothetical protein IPH44_37355 [Myxococcales bacterium]|nr:hypothetical protein [Myxococcales bacterium]